MELRPIATKTNWYACSASNSLPTPAATVAAMRARMAIGMSCGALKIRG